MALLFASTALAAPATTATTARPAATSAIVRAATPRVLAPSNPPTKQDVINSMTNWAASVNTVNAYLNDPNNSTKLTNALAFAKDEPVQLSTLMKVKGLSTKGTNSAKVLMGNFPSIVSNLQSVQSGVMNTQDATAAVNFNRCCTVLPAIGALWTAASNATKAPAMPPPNLENQCSQMKCAAGASAGSTPFNSSGTELTARALKAGITFNY
ncbi:hypothetical protein BP5796_01648 [Coleophoma crateriformis]|uniref:Uncharacterized protein n=1 Tax=Coleophoma crateriformis TaxID=565419 RepID=A0A3D8T140_9HELO|nr:hypothetical protein BP5796_01648 [Coleophoma crateriformis]